MSAGGAGTGIYQFGEYRVDANKRVLSRNGDLVPLTPRVFDTLLALVSHAGELLGKQELMQVVWRDTVVEENNLTQNIATLRRALCERHGEHRYILTVPGRGYRFVAPVDEPPQDALEFATLAVLPFENLSDDPAREYLADGLTEETITALGQVDPRHIGVIARTSVMVYKRTTKTAAEVGRELNAAYLVEGSLRAERGRLRVTTKLIRAQGQAQMWSASFDSEPRSVLEFQRELSLVIAEQIRLRLSPERLAALASRQTQNPDAYDHYLRGRHYWHQLTPETTRRALEHYALATQFDHDYALAWCGIADAWCAAPISGDAAPLAVLPQARNAVDQALRAQPNLAEAHASLGYLEFWLEWHWIGAERAFRDAVRIDANYSFAHRMLGLLYSHQGRAREAASTMQRARELEPLLAVHQALSSQVMFAGRDFEAAEKFARQAIVIDPDFWIGHMQLAQALVALGELEPALAVLNVAGRTSGGNSKVISLRGYVNALLARTPQAREAIDTLMSIARNRYVPPYAIALIEAGLGEIDSAFAWLERALTARDVHLTFLPIDNKWDSCRDDPRFADLLRRCGFASLQ